MGSQAKRRYAGHRPHSHAWVFCLGRRCLSNLPCLRAVPCPRKGRLAARPSSRLFAHAGPPALSAVWLRSRGSACVQLAFPRRVSSSYPNSHQLCNIAKRERTRLHTRTFRGDSDGAGPASGGSECDSCIRSPDRRCRHVARGLHVVSGPLWPFSARCFPTAASSPSTRPSRARPRSASRSAATRCAGTPGWTKGRSATPASCT